jgi:localization factor PodJL
VVAIGSYRLVTELTSQQGNQAFADRTSAGNASAPVIGAPAVDKVAAAETSELADPTTTASVPAARPNESPALQGAKSIPVAAGTRMPDAQPAFSAPAAAEAPPQKQTSQLPPASAGVPLPPRPAVEAGTSLREAALNGDPAALYELAVRTLEGRGVARDPRAAVSLFEKAGEKNLPIAQYRAGNAYEKGIGVSRDVEAARRWYQRAAENGNTRAMHNLAVLMAEGAAGRPDYGSAMTWFQKAADHGVRDSQFNLAVLFARGLGTQQDLVRSYTWFAVAAGQGDEEAGRKRDEVAARLQPADLARAKSAVERWRVTPPNTLANEAPAPAAKWSQAAMRRSAKA